MPFTIGGEWIPDATPAKQNKPVKIRKEKRRSSWVTIITNLPHGDVEMKNLCSSLKKRLGCGGTVNGDTIELQGDQIEAATAFLKEAK